MIKERPILMSAPMVRVILERRKTQTRRIIKPQPYLDALKCPYGNAGERLWVRETFCYKYDSDYKPLDNQYWYRSSNPDVEAIPDEGTELYRKDGSERSPWIPSIHMPRKASRILLEITSIRAERLQDISEDDAIAEGILFNGDYDLWWDYQREQWICVDPIDSYKSLICKINGPETWEKNPWVWVVEFKVIKVKGGSHENCSF